MDYEMSRFIMDTIGLKPVKRQPTFTSINSNHVHNLNHVYSFNDGVRGETEMRRGRHTSPGNNNDANSNSSMSCSSRVVDPAVADAV
eukprot:704418-Pyramimonas_sp.AAC.1